MAAKDIYHEHVKNALEKDGWTITDDPLKLDPMNEKLNRYRAIIETILMEIAQLSAKEEAVKDRTLFDRRSDSYAIIAEGWEKEDRVHDIVIHLEIINGKVWIQADNTDLIVARQLEKAGIPKSDIVLGFHPPRIRPHTDYAVA